MSEKNDNGLYKVSVKCGNCDYHNESLTLMKGKRVCDMPCPNCGNNTLVTQSKPQL